MKNNTSITNWSEGIKKMGEERRELNNKLSPNKNELKNALSYVREIYEIVLLMSNSSSFAHEDIISFELAQQILDAQKEYIKENINSLEIYLGIHKEEVQ